MKETIQRLGTLPFLLLGIGLLLLGLLSLNHIVNNFWPFDLSRLDLVRASEQGRADATALLNAANLEILLAFLASVMIAATGLVLPMVYYLNRRLRASEDTPHFLVVLRQAMWAGIWLAFCVWLQMNRTFGLAVATLVAVVLIMFEVLIQVRMRASTVFD